MVSVYTTPPGWYPDPSGEPRWRVWNGLDWSDVTRDYAGGDVDATPWPVALAVHRVARYGVAGVFAGLGLAVSVGAHWPGSAHPLNAVVAPTLLAVALTMIALGSVAYALAGREIKGRWSWDLVVPGVNVAAVSSMVTRQLGDPGPWRRAVTDVAVCALYALQYRAHPVLAFVPALVALDLSTSLARLSHRLGAESGRATSAS